MLFKNLENIDRIHKELFRVFVGVTVAVLLNTESWLTI